MVAYVVDRSHDGAAAQDGLAQPAHIEVHSSPRIQQDMEAEEQFKEDYC